MQTQKSNKDGKFEPSKSANRLASSSKQSKSEHPLSRCKSSNIKCRGTAKPTIDLQIEHPLTRCKLSSEHPCHPISIVDVSLMFGAGEDAVDFDHGRSLVIL
ncbi:hypothetical protein L6164_000922 [Bauhinia variegata]|uniref:Uncharacterized protein n=1 Tax=Bauhinia variegata TaxID=167791 RepID=A0ACB9Q888_BAUVA|nr:hypothetical protein L6164_000922 [Bauhinia variegata]